MAGELTTCRGQGARVRGARVKGTARGRAGATAADPSRSAVCRRGPAGHLVAQRLLLETRGRASLLGHTGRGGPGPGRRAGRAGEQPSAHTHAAQPRPSAHRLISPVPPPATPVFNTEKETVHGDRRRDPRASHSPSPGSALLVQERQGGGGAGGHAGTAERPRPPTHRTRHLGQFRPRPLKEPCAARLANPEEPERPPGRPGSSLTESSFHPHGPEGSHFSSSSHSLRPLPPPGIVM